MATTVAFADTSKPTRSVIAIDQAQLLPTNLDKSSEARSEFVPLSILNESLWQRMRAGFEFSEINNKRVDKQIKFMQAGLISLRSNLIDANPYLYHIVDKLERADVPLDIALLPLIESAFNPVARSSESAVGIWQFIPATANYYGLSVAKHNDQRKDVIASTDAAIRYLKDLHRQFSGDWMLALAAYNTGPGNVRSAMRSAIKRGREPTYWNLKLSEETSNYVPRLIAATKIISDPKTHGLILPPIANQKQIESVSVGRRISLAQVAELTDITVEEATELNPSLHQGLTPVDGPHRLILPVDTSSKLLIELAKFKRQTLVDKKSQALSVARGQINQFEIDSQVQSDSNEAAHQNYSTYKAYRYNTHTVRAGDSLWKVSRKLKVDIDTLRTWNNIEDGKPIKAGDKLRVAYLGTETADPANARLMNYRVTATDNLASIAKRFDLHIAEIKKWNDSVKHENHLQAGQILRIPTFQSIDTSLYGP